MATIKTELTDKGLCPFMRQAKHSNQLLAALADKARRLSNRAFRVAIYLLSNCRKDRGFAFDATLNAIAKGTGLSVSTVRRGIKELVEFKIINVFKNYNEEQGQAANTYAANLPVLGFAVVAVKRLKGNFESCTKKFKELVSPKKQKTQSEDWVQCDDFECDSKSSSQLIFA